jgi:hypothetical protein
MHYLVGLWSYMGSVMEDIERNRGNTTPLDGIKTRLLLLHIFFSSELWCCHATALSTTSITLSVIKSVLYSFSNDTTTTKKDSKLKDYAHTSFASFSSFKEVHVSLFFFFF